MAFGDALSRRGGTRIWRELGRGLLVMETTILKTPRHLPRQPGSASKSWKKRRRRDSLLLQAREQPADDGGLQTRAAAELRARSSTIQLGVLAPALQRGADCCIDYRYTKY